MNSRQFLHKLELVCDNQQSVPMTSLRLIILLTVYIVGWPDLIGQFCEAALRSCSSLHSYFYHCDPIKINPETQLPCFPDKNESYRCYPADSIQCDGLVEDASVGRYFLKMLPPDCAVPHIHFDKALLLSIFFGWLGLDRIYMGYYAIGLFKMFTVGGVVIFWMVDIVLIALQILQPADGSPWLMAYYGPRAQPTRFDSLTNFSMYFCNECY